MDRGELQKKAAEAIRELVDKNSKLEEEHKLYKECIKLAFELADGGPIEDTFESISSKADELIENKTEIEVIKRAMQLNSDYVPVGNLEKKASSESDSNATDIFKEILRRGY